MDQATLARPAAQSGTVRVLSARELPLFREHLLRLDRDSRHDRFNGALDDDFLATYAARCVSDGTIIIAYFENGVVRGAAELHQPDLSPGSLPEPMAMTMPMPTTIVLILPVSAFVISHVRANTIGTPGCLYGKY